MSIIPLPAKTENTLPGPLEFTRNPDGSVQCEIFCPRDCLFFEGHFPDHPVLPGVVMIAWMLEAAKALTGDDYSTGEIIQARFMVAVRGGREGIMKASYTPTKVKVRVIGEGRPRISLVLARKDIQRKPE